MGCDCIWVRTRCQPGGEWIRSNNRLSVAEYQPWVEALVPDSGCCREWARLAKRLGAEYVALTAKHHDGFCLFDSQHTTYSTKHSPAQRDSVREYVEALRAEGLRVGLYYSLVDWHHPDYPAWQDRQQPLRHDPASEARDARGDWGVTCATSLPRSKSYAPITGRLISSRLNFPTGISLAKNGVLRNWCS